MLTVIIKDCGEPNVIQLTFEQLYKELKDIPGSELLIKPSWDIRDVKNRYVCFVEADCLVSEGYFKQLLKSFDALSPRVVALTSATAVSRWENEIYGYSVGLNQNIVTMPIRRPKSRQKPYQVQIAYIPGTIIRTVSLKRILKELKIKDVEQDLVYYSLLVSLGIWQSGISTDAKHPLGQLGTQICMNPNVAYCTTEDYVNDIGQFEEVLDSTLLSLFSMESI